MDEAQKDYDLLVLRAPVFASRGKNISVEIQVAADLPEIQADAERLRQVLANLVDNTL